MQVHGPHGPKGISPIYGRRAVESPESIRPAGLEPPKDEVYISPEARALAELAQSNQIRQERLEQIRQMIAAGVYDTPERLAIAVEKMLQELKQTGMLPEAGK